MATAQRTFLPAAGHDWFLPLYDPLTKLLGADRVRVALLDQAALQPRHRVLDVGCGTGTLVVLIKRRYPMVEVIGLDPDPKALSRAQGKAERASRERGEFLAPRITRRTRTRARIPLFAGRSSATLAIPDERTGIAHVRYLSFQYAFCPT